MPSNAWARAESVHTPSAQGSPKRSGVGVAMPSVWKDGSRRPGPALADNGRGGTSWTGAKAPPTIIFIVGSELPRRWPAGGVMTGTSFGAPGSVGMTPKVSSGFSIDDPYPGEDKQDNVLERVGESRETLLIAGDGKARSTCGMDLCEASCFDVSSAGAIRRHCLSHVSGPTNYGAFLSFHSMGPERRRWPSIVTGARLKPEISKQRVAEDCSSERVEARALRRCVVSLVCIAR